MPDSSSAFPRVGLRETALGVCSHGRVEVPRDLRTRTAIDTSAECAPAELGLSAPRVEAIWTAVEQLYRSGLHPAITLALRHRGRIVLKRSIGEVGNGGALDPDSPVCLFSASKAISSLLVHKLVEQKRLRLDQRVADVIPEFAAQGKRSVTVRQLLSHRAAVPDIPMRHPDLEIVRDWDQVVALLCAATPFNSQFERQAYHALTAGFIAGELVRRVTGRELPELLREWIAEPLGCRYLTYGLAPALRALSPPSVCTGPKLVWPLTTYIRRIVGVTFNEAVEASNSDAFMSSVVPAGNIFASADDVCRVYQMLLNGGELDGVRVFKPATVAEALKPFGRIQFDRTLLMPMRFSPGFMLGENPVGLFGGGTREAYGHLGFISVLSWADPRREISVALLNTGKSLAPDGLLRLVQILAAIGRAFPVS